VLYIAGTAPRSMRAVRIIKELCEEYLPDCHNLQVVDIYQQPGLAEEAEVLAVPVLVRKRPHPEMRFVGDMTNARAILHALGLREKPSEADAG